ncbi:MAG: TetR/AcrR family transcriptional regulator, partial [Acidimicrobiales bacterium]|nr:TetR/AcrR family transcriptional regulator [Acidimicrobiales bacterium]
GAIPMREVPSAMADALHAAADDLLDRFDDLQMHDIAAAAGVARSSLYYYFTNKDDVLAYLLRAMLDDLTASTAAAAVGPGSPSTRLGAVIRAQLEHLDEHPAASQLLIANLGRAGKLPDIAASVNEGFEGPVRRLLAEGADDGSLRRLPDDDIGATALFGAVLVIGLRCLVVEGHIDVDRVMQMIGPMFWGGIAPTDGPPSVSG